jgi:NADH dehydrogenase [ubiquinone] 1 alpha subcomplex assembly factor 5
MSTRLSVGTMLLTNICRGSARLPRNIRSLAAISSSSPSPNPYTVGPFQVFDRAAKKLQKDRAIDRDAGVASRTVDYVRDEVADRMMERLLVRYTVSRKIKYITHDSVGYQTQI